MIIGAFCAAVCAASLVIHPDASITWQNRQIGVYVDDTVPAQCQVVTSDRREWPVVIAGQAPAGQPCPDATINALEWYFPFWLDLPKADAYIFPWHFYWPGTQPSTRAQRLSLYQAAERRGAELVLWY